MALFMFLKEFCVFETFMKTNKNDKMSNKVNIDAK